MEQDRQRGPRQRLTVRTSKWNEWCHFPVKFASNMNRILGRRGVRPLAENWGGCLIVHNDIQLGDA